MVRKIALICAAVVSGILSYASSRPSTFEIERSIRIEAQPKRVYSLLTDFHGWKLWSPWERLDPAMTRVFTGKQKGRGAVYEWAGEARVGSVRLEILDAVLDTRVVMRLDLKGPLEGRGIFAVYALERENGLTTVTWKVIGKKPYPLKLLGVFRDVDRMIARDCERGLVNLKNAAE
jgi:uncharacterized protein YndB with AHSA1/START domain